MRGNSFQKIENGGVCGSLFFSWSCAIWSAQRMLNYIVVTHIEKKECENFVQWHKIFILPVHFMQMWRKLLSFKSKTNLRLRVKLHITSVGRPQLQYNSILKKLIEFRGMTSSQRNDKS